MENKSNNSETLQELQKDFSFKLIDGVFSGEQAKDILLDLVNSKIHFHNQEIFSIQIRFGRDSAHSIKRVSELKQVRDDLLQLFNKLNDNSFSFNISSNVTIEALPS